MVEVDRRRLRSNSKRKDATTRETNDSNKRKNNSKIRYIVGTREKYTQEIPYPNSWFINTAVKFYRTTVTDSRFLSTVFVLLSDLSDRRFLNL